MERRQKGNDKEIIILNELGFRVEEIDLRDYFDKKNELRSKTSNYGGVWIRGGNSFILLQAMKLSGFDEIIKEIYENNQDFLYSGYSAGASILAPSLEGLDKVDDPNIFPYNEIKKPIYEGLNILDYVIMPHYNSDHDESKLMDEEIEYCEKNDIKYKTLSDGDEIIIVNKVYENKIVNKKLS